MSLENEEKINSKQVLFAKKTDSGLIWLEPHEAEDWYGTFLGEVKGLHPHGQGSFISIDGLKYIGEWYSPKSGKGTFTWSNGKTYEGEWSNGKEHGYGTMTFLNGAKYKGEFKQAYREGHGIFSHSNGDIYDGEWKKGKPNGYGKYTWKDGHKYVGDFKIGLISGKGEIIWPYDEDLYKRKQQKRKQQEESERLNEEDDIFRIVGIEKLSEPDVPGLGKSYSGDLLNGFPHGFGTWKYRNGTKFSGNFKKGIRHGYGKLFARNGSIICKGNYIDNKLERKKLFVSDNDDYEGDSERYENYGYDESTSAWDLAPDGIWSDDWDDSSYSHEEWSVSDYNTELWLRGGLIEDNEWAESNDYDEWAESDD